MKDLKILFCLLFSLSCGTNECKDLIYKDGITTKDGVLFDGKCKTIFEDGATKSLQEYINGKDHGNWKFFFENGQIETNGYFVNGFRDSTWTYHYDNGIIKQISNYKMGKRDGDWINYSKNGEITLKVIYDMDSLITKF